MATLVFAMNVSLDGYVDHDKFAPGPALFRHWIEVERQLTGSIYGRRVYELMRYWETDQPEWSDDEREFADVWRRMPKWVVSRSLNEVGPNTTLINDDAESAIRELKDRYKGELSIGGPQLAHSMSALIDEYRLYVHPVVLGGGAPFFAGPIPPLRFEGSETIDEEVVRLRYSAR